MEEQDVLTTGEAAKYIRHSVRTMIRWRQERVGPPFIQCGKKILYRKQSLDRWLAEREQQPVAA